MEKLSDTDINILSALYLEADSRIMPNFIQK